MNLENDQPMTDDEAQNVVELIDRPIAFQRAYVTITGSVNAALMLSQAVYWGARSTVGDKWFWKTMAEWQEETGLTRYEQETARTKLKGFVQSELRETPAKLFFRVNYVAVAEALKSINSTQPRMRKPSNQGCGTPATKNGGIPQPTLQETTSETPSEKKNAPRKRDAVPSDHQLLIDTWSESYKAQHGTKYMMTGNKDGPAVKRLLAIATVEEIMAVATRAWSSATGFHGEQAMTLAGLAGDWNVLANGKGKGPVATPGRAAAPRAMAEPIRTDPVGDITEYAMQVLARRDKERFAREAAAREARAKELAATNEGVA